MTARDTSDLTITRTIRAPRQRVFDAFVKPELVRQWFGARGFTIMDADIDPRVGGRYRMTMRPRTGEPYTVVGQYRESRRRSAYRSHGNGRASRWAPFPKRSSR